MSVHLDVWGRRALLGLSFLFAGTGCDKRTEPQTEAKAAPAQDNNEAAVAVAGRWRATLLSPGGELPFPLQILENGDGLAAYTLNGEERVDYTAVEQKGRALTLSLDHYDSRIEARVNEAGDSMKGKWTKTVSDGKTATLAFTAKRSDDARFRDADFPEPDPEPEPDPSAPPMEPDPEAKRPESIAGSWAAEFREGLGDTFPGRVEVVQEEGGRVLATVLTDTGDYRYLEGKWRNGHLRMSTFDGGHAFLFHAKWDPEFKGLDGDFWSRDTYHADWRAFRIDPDKQGREKDSLADPWKMTSVRSEDGRVHFSFPDVDGKTVTDADDRFAGKVLVIDVFGSWCPNCNDQAPLLQAWYEAYADKGLEIVGLAFEMTGDATRDTEFVKKYVARHGLTFPVLVAGTSDKADATRALTDLSPIKAYPTTIFVGKDGAVHKIHTGYAGPATGEAHLELKRELTATLEELLGIEPTEPTAQPEL